jgi:hypothetical protein
MKAQRLYLREIHIHTYTWYAAYNFVRVSNSLKPNPNLRNFLSDGDYILLKNIFGNNGVGTQGLALVRQVLYHLCHTPSPFLF